MEVSSLTRTGSVAGLRGASPLLRLQSDERLIALTRRGQHAAFEALCARYQSRLLSFCRHMLASREDAEDVLQEVFTAAFNAVLADERAINVRPWLYRIARNRSLNHLRRASALGVDSMDVHYAEHGMSTGDQVIRRESFRELLGDVHQLPETQRTALLLREIDALSYDQIAHAMETTVPSVKSLLVRARISLAEAAEARKLSCSEVRLELGQAAEGLLKLSPPARRHVRDCDRCRMFKKQLRENNRALAAILPVGPLIMLKKLVLAKVGSTASAGSAHVAGGAGATVGAGAGVAAGAGAGAAGGAGAGGIFTMGAGALATKAVAGLAVAAIVSAGAVAAHQATSHHRASHPRASYAALTPRVSEPAVLSERLQPPSAANRKLAFSARHRSRQRHVVATAKLLATAVPTLPAANVQAPAAPVVKAPAPAEAPVTQVTQVTSSTTELPATATAPATTTTTATVPATTTATPTTPAAGAAPPPASPPASAEPAPSAPTGPAAQAPPNTNEVPGQTSSQTPPSQESPQQPAEGQAGSPGQSPPEALNGTETPAGAAGLTSTSPGAGRQSVGSP